MKKRLIGIDVPAAARVGRADRVVLHGGDEDALVPGGVDRQERRVLRDRGRGRVVYWFVPGPKAVAGAPTSPRKTWFQTPFDHGPIVLLRVKNCCWPKLPTRPFNWSLAKNRR